MIQILELIKSGIFENKVFADQLDYFTSVSKSLEENSYVNEAFMDEIIKREKEFPTGIQTKTIGISLPHVENTFVNTNALVIHVFNPPLLFHRMDNTDETIPVTISFMLLIKDVAEHIKAIQQLAFIFQDDYLLERIGKCRSYEELIEIFEVYDGNKQEIA